MKKTYLLIMLSIILNSCYDKVLNDPERSHGHVKIIVYDKSNTPVKNARVIIGSNDYGSFTNYDDSTDAKGEFNADIVEGYHDIYISIYADNISYNSFEFLQMIGGLNRVCEYRPYDNKGHINIKLVNSKGIPIPGINVTLLTKVIDNKNLSFEEYNKYAYLTGKTDSNARISFTDIPMGHRFGYLIFQNESNYSYRNEGLQASEYDSEYYQLQCDF